jgi:apolipoprotein N-acyltransferase
VQTKIRTRFWIEIVLAAVSGFLCVLTFASRDWVEVIFRVDPDQHSGALEWTIAFSFVIATIVFGVLARNEWRRPPQHES